MQPKGPKIELDPSVKLIDEKLKSLYHFYDVYETLAKSGKYQRIKLELQGKIFKYSFNELEDDDSSNKPLVPKYIEKLIELLDTDPLKFSNITKSGKDDDLDEYLDKDPFELTGTICEKMQNFFLIALDILKVAPKKGPDVNLIQSTINLISIHIELFNELNNKVFAVYPNEFADEKKKMEKLIADIKTAINHLARGKSALGPSGNQRIPKEPIILKTTQTQIQQKKFKEQLAYYNPVKSKAASAVAQNGPRNPLTVQPKTKMPSWTQKHPLKSKKFRQPVSKKISQKIAQLTKTEQLHHKS